MRPVKHLQIDVDGVDTFYREAGPANAPVVLLPHGYPCSSYEFRNLIPLLADRWRLLAPDFPGCGYSATPDNFSYDFDGYARFLGDFADRVGARRFVLYLHDFGSQIGLRLAIAEPQRVTGLIIQNGDIYEDQLGTAVRCAEGVLEESDAASEGEARGSNHGRGVSRGILEPRR